MPRKGTRRLKPVEDLPSTPSEAIARARVFVFRQAVEALAIAKAVTEEATTDDPRRQEISEALKVLRQAVTDTGLEILRPIVTELKRPIAGAEAPASEVVSNDGKLVDRGTE